MAELVDFVAQAHQIQIAQDASQRQSLSDGLHRLGRWYIDRARLRFESRPDQGDDDPPKSAELEAKDSSWRSTFVAVKTHRMADSGYYRTLRQVRSLFHLSSATRDSTYIGPMFILPARPRDTPLGRLDPPKHCAVSRLLISSEQR